MRLVVNYKTKREYFINWHGTFCKNDIHTSIGVNLFMLAQLAEFWAKIGRRPVVIVVVVVYLHVYNSLRPAVLSFHCTLYCKLSVLQAIYTASYLY